MSLRDVFRADRPVIGVLHLPALPGSPAHELSLRQISDHVVRDADALASGGVDGLILENFGDAPFYPDRVPPHTVAQMSVVGETIARQFAELPLGINVLRNDARSALAVASAIGAQFVRVNVYCGARVADQGIIQGEAHEVLRYRASLDSSVRIVADIDVKHSTPLGDYDLETDVHDVVSRGRADGVIVSGTGTGRTTSAEDLERAQAAANGAVPVWIGSGVNRDNLATLYAAADGFIVGSTFKADGAAANPVDSARVKAFMARMGELQNQQEV